MFSDIGRLTTCYFFVLNSTSSNFLLPLYMYRIDYTKLYVCRFSFVLRLLLLAGEAFYKLREVWV